jgi:Domain of unknown function (DUF4287)
MAKTPGQVLQSYYRNIETKTGVSIQSWYARIRESGKTKHAEIVAWLKTEHGFGHGHATRLAYDVTHIEAD